MAKEKKKRKTDEDRVPVPSRLVKIIREKSGDSGVTQKRIVEQLLTTAMKMRGWLPKEATEPALDEG